MAAPASATTLAPHTPGTATRHAESARVEQWLVVLPTAIGCARRFAHHALSHPRMAGIHPAVAAAAARMAVALVADAVTASRIAERQSTLLDLLRRDLKLIKLALRADGEHLVIEVWCADSAPACPRPGHMAGVAITSDRHRPASGGETVRVAMSPADIGQQARAAEPWTSTDPAVLQQVLDGLRKLPARHHPA